MVRDYLVTAAVMTALSGIWLAVRWLRQAGGERDPHPPCKSLNKHCGRSPCRCIEPPGERS